MERKFYYEVPILVLIDEKDFRDRVALRVKIESYGSGNRFVD